MMEKIQGIKLGNTITFFINGKLHKKTFSSKEESDKVYRLVLEAKQNPSKQALDNVLSYLNINTRIARENGLEYDIESGSVFLAGFNTPIPQLLVDTIEEYHENNYPLDAIVNFWKLLMINPDTRVRESAFKFIATHDFALTDNGYMVVYKAVDYKEKKDNDLAEFVSNQYVHIRKDWKCSPNKYVAYRNLEDDTLAITKTETAEGWDVEEKNVELLGKVGDLFAQIDALIEDGGSVYTDKHTHSMEIQLGVPVQMKRKECDGDPSQDCSYGLHCGATTYVENFGSCDGAVLVCLVNPAHIVAVPESDNSKFRTSEYFPFALATYCDGKIDIIDQPFFESDYKTYEETELNKLVKKIQKKETPFEKAKNSNEETRDLNELMKIIKMRLVDLNTL